MIPEEVVRAAFAAYRARDRDTAETLYAPRFTFTSPQDRRLDRTTWLDVCFPTADRFSRQTLLHVVADGPQVTVVYEYDLADGTTWRNAELITVEGGQIIETQVLFGPRVT